MKPQGKTSPGAYARRLEQALSDHCGRAVLLSPRDWALVVEWYESGVPLGLVLEALERASHGGSRTRRARSRGPASLASVAAAVEEAWQVVRAGRIVARSEAGDARLPLSGARQDWQEVAEREPRGSPLRRLLAELLRRLDDGEDLVLLDRQLDRGLPLAVPATLVERVREEATRDLAPYRVRMAVDSFVATRERAVADRLRGTLKLPRLALSDPAC